MMQLRSTIIIFISGVIRALITYSAMGWTTEGSEFESRCGKELSPFHVVQTGTVTHAASYPMGKGALSAGIKRSGREVDQNLN
jgi:hypothetical protein